MEETNDEKEEVIIPVDWIFNIGGKVDRDANQDDDGNCKTAPQCCRGYQASDEERDYRGGIQKCEVDESAEGVLTADRHDLGYRALGFRVVDTKDDTVFGDFYKRRGSQATLY